MPLFNVMIPTNANNIFKIIMQIASFDLVETDDYVQEMFKLPDIQNPNEDLGDLGMPLIWYLTSIGSLIIIFAIYPALLLVFLLNKGYLWLQDKPYDGKLYRI